MLAASCTLSLSTGEQRERGPAPDPTPSTQKKTLCSSPLFTKMYFCDTPKYRHLPRTQVVKQCNVSSAQGAGSGHLGMEGRASWEHRAAAPPQGWEGKTPGGKGQVPLRGAAPCRSARRIQQQAGPGGKKSHAPGLPAVSPAPGPCFGRGLLTQPRERSSSELRWGSTRYSDTFGAHTSLELSPEFSKVKPQGSTGGSPLWAVPRAGPEASACCCRAVGGAPA